MMWNPHFLIAALFSAAALLPLPAPAESGNMQYPVKACPRITGPDALRALAQRCAGDLKQDANCRAHVKDENEDYVIVKDCSPTKAQGYLLIPVPSVSGIDDARIFSAPFLNLWDDAWRWSQKYPGEPASRTGLAVNSKNARSQNQLHIHISCVLPEVSEALESGSIPVYPAKPVMLQLGPQKNSYSAVKIASLTGDSSPFKVTQGFLSAGDNMKDQSIAVVGSEEPGEFYVLDTATQGANRGHAEELLEQTCGGNP